MKETRTIKRNWKTLERLILAFTILLILSLPGSPVPVVADSLEGTGENRVGLVVQVDATTLITRCVRFSESEITGLEALQRSGLEVVNSQGAICAIAGTGCPADDCFCQFNAPERRYWSYWHWDTATSSWSLSNAGASAYRVRDGDIEGWYWRGEVLPVDIDLDTICRPFRLHLPIIHRMS